jgi:phosphoglycolate phosphatase-like HAD superfamily hydrolase
LLSQLPEFANAATGLTGSPMRTALVDTDFRAVLLDIDGTLIDSNDAHARAWVDAFAAHGRHADFDRVRALIGMGGDKVLSIVAGLDSQTSEGRVIADTRQAIFSRDYLPHLQATPGAEQLLEWFHDHQVTITIATSADGDDLRDLLSVIHATSLVEKATTSDDAEESKPDPDIVVAALRRSTYPADVTVMIGDTPYDIEAARRVDVATIAFRCGGWADSDLAGAIAIYDHPAHFLEQLESSIS